MLIEEKQDSIEQNEPIITTGGCFIINDGNKLKKYRVSGGEPCLYSTISLDQTPDSTKPGVYVPDYLAQETVLARIIDIFHDDEGKRRAKIEVFLPKGKVEKVLSTVNVDMLERLNLLDLGTEFDIQYTVKEDCTTTKFLKRQIEEFEELFDLYDEFLDY